VTDARGLEGDAADVTEHRFGQAPPATLGVEEELFFVDAESLDAVPAFTQIVGEVTERTKPEVFESLVELATPVLADADEVLAALTRLRAEVAARAAASGLRLYAAGSHPFASGADQELVPLPRYTKMAASLGEVLRRQLVCGLHVHVSVADPDAALLAFESVVPWLPVLLALSANSPFADGSDTGRRSERAERLLLMPTGGTPPVLRSWDDWRLATGRDSTRRHWDAWPRPEYGTLEVRVMDMQTDVRRSAGLAAIVRALVLTVPGTVKTLPRKGAARRGFAVPGTVKTLEPYDRRLYARRREEASRLPPDPADVEALAAAIEPVLEGEDRELARLVLEGRPEAERQLEVAAAGGIAAVPGDVAGRTLG
jgi:glutamate---cysteine ligase / carboxylate-amine ligase